MKLNVKFVGAEHNEQMPVVALYQVNASGQVTRKLDESRDGTLEVGAELAKQKSAVVAVGPDVEDLSKLDPKALVQLRVSDQLAEWQKSKEFIVPNQWWRRWHYFTACVSGNVSKCRPWLLDTTALKGDRAGKAEIAAFS